MIACSHCGATTAPEDEDLVALYAAQLAQDGEYQLKQVRDGIIEVVGILPHATQTIWICTRCMRKMLK